MYIFLIGKDVWLPLGRMKFHIGKKHWCLPPGTSYENMDDDSDDDGGGGVDDVYLAENGPDWNNDILLLKIWVKYWHVLTLSIVILALYAVPWRYPLPTSHAYIPPRVKGLTN